MSALDLVAITGRCRSGKRWFWAGRVFAFGTEEEITVHGKADNETAAMAEARAAVEQILDGRPARWRTSHGFAARTLKDINAERRAARPGKPGPATPREYVYGIGRTWDEYEIEHPVVVSFPVTRKTAKRVYYARRSFVRVEGGPEEIDERYVDRQRLETDGKATRASGWYEADFTVYAEPPELNQQPTAAPPADVKALRRAMADAHPDRGGDPDAFMAAQARYERAKERAITTSETS